MVREPQEVVPYWSWSGGIPQPDAPQERSMIGHADQRVIIDHPDGDPLSRPQQADPRRVARVELPLSRLHAAGTTQEGGGVYHHLVAGNVREVEIVHLVNRWRRRRERR